MFTEDIYTFLQIFDEKRVNDKATYTQQIHELMSTDDFIKAMETAFKDFKVNNPNESAIWLILNDIFPTQQDFSSMAEAERYQLVNCFNRRFFNEALIRKVELECSQVEKKAKLIRPYPLMSIKESLQKEENVVHHIGGYIVHELILQYGNEARTFVKNSVNICSDVNDDYAKWTQELSNGRLIKLKEKAFEFMMKLNEISKVHFQTLNLKMKDRVNKALQDLENSDAFKRSWFELWGDGVVSEAAKKKACQIFLNCLGKGYVGKIKTNVQIQKRASLQSISLRKEMKSQKPCTKCKDAPKENKVKVPRVKKILKDF